MENWFNVVMRVRALSSEWDISGELRRSISENKKKGGETNKNGWLFRKYKKIDQLIICFCSSFFLWFSLLIELRIVEFIS